MAVGSMVVDHTQTGAAFRRLSIPVAVQMLGDQLLSIVDTIAIGSLGVVALAGATAATTIFFAVAFAAAGCMSGTSIVAAQRIGGRDLDGFARTVRAGVVGPMLIGVIAFALSLFGAHWTIHALVGPLASAHASALYLILRCASIVPMVVSGTLIVGLAAAGNRQLGVLVLLVVNLVHLPLLAILALGWGTHHPFGIAGAGVSSLLSETIAAIYAIVYVARRPQYRVFSELTLSWQLAKRCALLGSPEAIFLLGVMVPDVFIVGMLAPLGAMAVAAFRALNIVSDVTFVVPSPLQNATQIVIGQRLGAGDSAGAQSFFKRALRLSFLFTTLTGIVTALMAWPLAYLFTLDATVATMAALPLAVHMITLPLKGWAMISLAPIRASGDTRFSMVLGLVCSGLVIPLTYVGIERLHLGLYSVALGWIVAWGVRAAVTQWKLRDGAWTRRAPLAA
ncbi:MAG: MATE family efflux transporter [Candidatus Eremiobacteraeota bacterium]|nr:MATE family efflux transporter [Candidatus Eremiobacteraeota bacterium]